MHIGNALDESMRVMLDLSWCEWAFFQHFQQIFLHILADQIDPALLAEGFFKLDDIFVAEGFKDLDFAEDDAFVFFVSIVLLELFDGHQLPRLLVSALQHHPVLALPNTFQNFVFIHQCNNFKQYPFLPNRLPFANRQLSPQLYPTHHPRLEYLQKCFANQRLKALSCRQAKMDQQPTELEASCLEQSEKRYRRSDVDTNEDQCFSCGKKGKLNCCQTCVRTFHQKCSPLKKNATGEWQCHICQSTRLCQFCGLKAQETAATLCTICCLPSHSLCFMQYHNAPKELIESSLLKQSSYVCKGCLKKHGIKYIKQVARCGNNIEEKLVSLIQINYKSPVHFGIFKEKEVIQANQLFKNSNRPKSSTQTFMNSQHYSTFYKSIIIQKLIQIKIPKKYEAEKTKNIHNLLISEQRQRGLSFGNPDNFWFLIKWKHANYSYCTWQDEVIVSRLDLDKKHRLAFIRCEDPPRPQSKVNLIRLLRQNGIPWDQSIVYGAIIKASRYNMIYPIQVIDFNLIDRALSFVCYYLAHSIAIEGCNQISIVLSSWENMQTWRKCLTEMRPVIDFVEFGGSQANIHAIKMKELSNSSRPKFHVLLMTFETFQSEQKFFASKMKNVAFLILQNHRLSVEIVHHFKAKNTILLAKGAMGKKDFLMEIRHAFRDTFIFWNNICMNSAEVIPPYDFTFNSLNINGQSEHIKYFKVYNIREEKRIAIIRFILRFGIPIDNFRELYSLMKAFEPTIFTMPELKAEAYQSFQGYIRSLMILLSIHSEVYLDPLVKLYYLVNVDPSKIQTRLLNCEKLRIFIKQEGSLSLPASVMKDTSSNNLGQFTNWKAEDDYLLIKLVVEYGYDNWQVIFNCKDWCKYANNPHNSHLTFLAYLKLRVILQFKVKTADYLQFVENRIELICNNL